ncbi:AGE family epimerase/isomerase [Maribacter ulvicola]|uniref:N-acylglucosamine 2-epimerase n=1 Tax=Maribacter ulvicola TaxID=228959 RepID=A0A1N6X962_9FLAO|nr:AGE family epimerase/isomerase [Maribacter ulvicola]SIQ98885.1 N-acylglucosamine 2-epimerase [Maribacter ulvicola]
MKELINQYKNGLLEDVIPFWSRYSLDKVHGGYLTSLDRKGNVFDTDKYAWPIGRQIWTYSKLYNEVEKKPEWLAIAQSGAEFLVENGMDEDGKFYFSFDQQGNSLKKPSNIYSDCFAALGFSQYYKASRNAKYRTLAREVYDRIEKRWSNPKHIFNKETGIRPMMGMGKLMLDANMALEMEGVLDNDTIISLKSNSIRKLLTHHYDEKVELFFENVAPDGSHPDTVDGRLIVPGHAVESMWMIMDLAAQTNDIKTIQKATDITIKMLSYSWDDQFGGIYYFMDWKNKPMQWKLDWDQKLWWVHNEALIALLKAFHHTRRADVWSWFKKVHTYTWKYFPDPEFGEWYGYLNRRGEVLLDLKGSFKGCYHLPRSLYECWKTLEKIAHDNDKS